MPTKKYPVAEVNNSKFNGLINYGQQSFGSGAEGTLTFRPASSADNLANLDVAKINSVTLYFTAWETSGPSMTKVGYKPAGAGSSNPYSYPFNSGAGSYNTSGKVYSGSYNLSVFKMSYLSGDFNITRTVGSAVVNNMYIQIDYTINTYTISVSSNGNGSVTGGGSGLTKGQQVSISAQPNEGYVFAYWSDGDRNPNRTISASANVTYTATFVPKLSVARATYVQNGAEGFYVYAQVADTGNGINRVQFPTWTNENGQDDLLTDWTTNSMASGTAGSWTVGNLTYNYRYYVKVSDHNNEYLGYNTHIYPYDNSGNQGTTGGVALNMRFTAYTQISIQEAGVITPSTTVDYGTSITISATANVGYRFLYWRNKEGTILSVNSSYTFSVVSDNTYVAVFEKIPRYVTYDTIFSFLKWKQEGINSGSASISNLTDTGLVLTSNSDVAEGTASSYIFPMQENQQYKVDIDITGDNWDVYIFFYDDSTQSGLGLEFADGPKNRFSSSGVNPERIFTAPAGTTRAVIRIDANGSNNSVTFNNFRIYPAEYEYMSTTVVAEERSDTESWSMPTPYREGYTFQGWNTAIDGSGEEYNGQKPFPMSGDLILYSQWERIYFKVKIFIEGEGTVSPMISQIFYGENLTFVFSPAEYYEIYRVEVNDELVELVNETISFYNIQNDISIVTIFRPLVPKINSVFIERDQTIDGVIMNEGINIIVNIIQEILKNESVYTLDNQRLMDNSGRIIFSADNGGRYLSSYSGDTIENFILEVLNNG